jgi:hypothetical protein
MNISSTHETNIVSPSKNIHVQGEQEQASISYKLVSPKKGKLYRGPNFNAFNRETLGSIPGKNENVLVRDNNIPKLGFSSNTQRFTKDDVISPGPGSYNVSKSTMISSPKDTTSSKGYLNGFVSKSNRFDTLKEFYDKFSPAPGHYNNSETTSLFSEIKKSICYKNLYEKNEVIPLKIKEESPGPGNYDLISSSKKEPKNDFFFQKKPEKFFKLKQDIFPGPGRYEIDSGFSIPERDKHTSHFFKKPVFNDKEKFKEDVVLGKEINKETDIPGVGEYNIGNYFGRRNHVNNAPYQMVKVNEYIVPKSDKSQNQGTEFYEMKSSFDGKKSFDSVFKSHSPKIKLIEKNHVPGPAFYFEKNNQISSFNYSNIKKYHM